MIRPFHWSYCITGHFCGETHNLFSGTEIFTCKLMNNDSDLKIDNRVTKANISSPLICPALL